MPLSKDPANYGRFYEELAATMEEGPAEIVFELSRKEALHERAKVYGYIYALEATAKRFRQEGNVKGASLYQAQAATMRGYLIQIDANVEPTKLRFVNRDLAPKTENLLAQLDKQRTQGERFIADTLPDDIDLSPNLTNFFSTPLEIKDATDDESST